MSFTLLTNQQMAEADRKTIESGTDGFELMQRAATAATDVTLEASLHQHALVICGPGNNGGDGFLIAKNLAEQGWSVRVACLVDKSKLKGDAARAAGEWRGEIENFSIEPHEEDLVIDAVFGTGLDRPLEEPVTSLFKKICDLDLPVIAVDIPSGVNGDTGTADAHTMAAQITVTFQSKTLGHALYPGAGYCGEIVVADIGIEIDGENAVYENAPDLWLDALPFKTAQSHKYDYGLACIYAAPEMTGATQLAASACARMGAGLVNVLSKDKGDVFRAALPAHIIVRDDPDWFDDRVTACLYGSGGLSGDVNIKDGVAYVLDADAIQKAPKKLNDKIVLTPHEGEFTKAFPDLKGSKLEKAKAVAGQAGAVIVLKGPDTVIAHPDGRTAVNTHSSPHLATAGSGDVLAGMITGLAAQDMDVFDAACAAVWIHGECAMRFGAGLVAEDLPEIIPDVLEDLLGFSEELR